MHFNATAPAGFEPPAAQLPPARCDVAFEHREAAALLVVGIQRLLCPEELADSVPDDVVEAFADPLVHLEALDHVDRLLQALVPLGESR